MTMYSFMGRGQPEEFRCRVYDGTPCKANTPTDPEEAKRRDFVDLLAGPGAIDCEAYDQWVAALQGRGWLPKEPTLEPNPDGEGRIGRWRLTAYGRAEWDRMRGA